MASTGIVFDIQRGAFHDGPGVRTTVFLKGCPLRCQWCHNPESWSLQPQQAAPACEGEPPVTYGREMSVEDVMRIVRRDHLFYKNSGGGLTVSGGEPTMQFEFCRELLRAAQAEGIHTCLDTCGFGPEERFAELAPLVDLFLWDYKATGDVLHTEITGVPVMPILRNFQRIYESGAPVVLRCPMAPGVNDSQEHFDAIARLAREHPRLAGIDILPWHPAGLGKFGRLGLPRPGLKTHVPDERTKSLWREFFEKRGMENVTLP